MDQTATNEAIGKIQKVALPIGIVGLILSGVGFATNQTQFFESYLIAFIFWVGISVGSLAWLMLPPTKYSILLLSAPDPAAMWRLSVPRSLA